MVKIKRNSRIHNFSYKQKQMNDKFLFDKDLNISRQSHGENQRKQEIHNF